ncbi:hypothetical protein UlMin_037712 [Ulmus minor]
MIIFLVEIWWWNADVQQAITEKKRCFKDWQRATYLKSFELYKQAKRLNTKVVREAKKRAYDNLYNRLVLMHDKAILYRWKDYFRNLPNGTHVGELNFEEFDLQEGRHHVFHRRLNEKLVGEALKRMKARKVVGPNDIPIEAWKCFREVGIQWLTSFFNRILETRKMPNLWRHNIVVVAIYKNKGDIQNCSNYREIKVMSHTMKLWERVIEQRLRSLTTVSENQFGFMPGRCTMEPIFLLRQVIERYREEH